MSTSTLIAIYFLIWWVTLFAVLPWGVRNQEESGDVIPGTDPGAPATHRVWQKLGWTTLVATVIFGILYVALFAQPYSVRFPDDDFRSAASLNRCGSSKKEQGPEPCS